MECRRVTAGRLFERSETGRRPDSVIQPSAHTDTKPAGRRVTVASSRFGLRRGETFRSVALPSDVVSTGYLPRHVRRRVCRAAAMVIKVAWSVWILSQLFGYLKFPIRVSKFLSTYYFTLFSLLAVPRFLCT